MKVVEDFDSGPRKAVTCLVDRDKKDTVVEHCQGEARLKEKEGRDEVRRLEEVMNAKEWKRIEANERRETDVAGVGVNWKESSGVQSFKAEIGPSGESGGLAGDEEDGKLR